MDDPPNNSGNETSNLIQGALHANQKLQIILNEQAERLETELKGLDHLLAVSNVDEAVEDPECEISIPGSKRATGLFPSSEFLNEASPFFSEARKRVDYVTKITPRPMKDRDLEALADAVKRENTRLKAYEDAFMSIPLAQNGGDEATDRVNNLEGLDWTRIAERVSDTSTTTRTATECRIAWLANKRPAVNHSTWSTEELSQLNRLVVESEQQNKPVNWVDIAERLGTSRIPIDCMRHGTARPRHTWTTESDHTLMEAVELFGLDNWHLVAGTVSEHATPSQCQGRWTKSVDPSIKRRAWTIDEDDRLRKAVEGYGQSWIQVATAIPGRTNDQCRERWSEHLNVGDQIVWTEAEDKILRNSVQEFGNKWKEISKRLDGVKTGQACRARYDKLKRAENRQESQLVESSAPAPPLVHPPIMGSFQCLSPAGTPSSTTSCQDLQFAVPARPRPTSRATAKPAEVSIGPDTITSELIPGVAPAGSRLPAASKPTEASASVQAADPLPPPQKKGRKRKAVEDCLPTVSSSEVPKRTRVTRSQTKAKKSS